MNAKYAINGDGNHVTTTTISLPKRWIIIDYWMIAWACVWIDGYSDFIEFHSYVLFIHSIVHYIH